MIGRVFLFLIIFVGTLVWRFPYEAAIADRVARLEARTGAQVDYTPESASIMGVEWKDMRVTTRTGLKVQFDQAKLRPTLNGMSAYATQGKSQGRMVMGPTGDLNIRMDQLNIDSGSKTFGEMNVTGNVTHSFQKRAGEGSLRLVLAHHQIPLPIEVETFESGNRLFWQDRGQGYELRIEVKVLGGTEFSADGDILLTPQPGLPHSLSGKLNIQTKLGKRRLMLQGTWKDPHWTMVSDS